jgi:hypothetical protein
MTVNGVPGTVSRTPHLSRSGLRQLRALGLLLLAGCSSRSTPERALLGVWQAAGVDSLQFTDTRFRRVEVNSTMHNGKETYLDPTITTWPKWRVLRNPQVNQASICLDTGGVGTETCADYRQEGNVLWVNFRYPHAMSNRYVRVP